MVIYADTSFLFSLYGSDSNSPRAKSWAVEAEIPVRFLELTLFELENALRFAASRGFIPSSQSDGSLLRIKDAIDGKRLVLTVCNYANVVERARHLSATHTPTGSHRSFDILHVAMALELEAEQFLTFDGNQRELAEAEGLIVPL